MKQLLPHTVQAKNYCIHGACARVYFYNHNSVPHFQNAAFQFCVLNWLLILGYVYMYNIVYYTPCTTLPHWPKFNSDVPGPGITSVLKIMIHLISGFCQLVTAYCSHSCEPITSHNYYSVIYFFISCMQAKAEWLHDRCYN